MKLTNEEKKIIRYSGITCAVLMIVLLGLAFFISQISWKWCFSLMMGYVATLIGFLKTIYVYTKAVYGDYERPSKMMIGNNLTNSLIYFSCCIINFIIPIFNIWLALVGMLIIKIIIILLFGVKPGIKGGEHIDI